MPSDRIDPPNDSIREIGVIRPGDTLLLSTDKMLTNEQADMIRKAVTDEMPDVNVVIVSGLKATVERA